MSLHHFPKIITGGLVTCLDAGNPLSYAGLGPELVTNSNLLVADDGNYETVTRNSTTNISITNNLGSVVFGKTYQVSWNVLNLRESNTGVQIRRGSNFMSGSPNLALVPNFYTSTFTNNLSDGDMNIYGDNTAGVDFDLDYLSVKELPTTINDLTGNSNNCVFASTTQCPKFSTNNKGMFIFDGGDSMTTIKTMSQMNVSDTSFSICCYINRSSIYNQALQGVFGLSQGTLSIKTNATNLFLDVFSNTDARYLPQFASGAINDKWLYLTVTVDNNIVKTYCNGTLSATTTLNDNIKSIQSLPLSFGIGYGYYQYKGDIGQVLMYNIVLSNEQILQNYLATKGRYGL
jgi:hypothetical protein